MPYILMILIALFLPFSAANAYTEEGFRSFLKEVAADARSQGVSDLTISMALQSATFKPRTIELDRAQPEKKTLYAEYKPKILSQDRIDKGRLMYKQHRVQLNHFANIYGVEPQYIVALWGIETNYGGFTGGTGIIDALATMAYEGRRREFFQKELVEALKILDEKHITLDEMKGSWAGAMGQNQFMPSSFRAYAVDGDGDGKRDIWKDLDDVFASTANYLRQSGWQHNQGWGQRVKLPQGIPATMVGKEYRRPIAYWQKLGVKTLNGHNLSANKRLEAYIVAPDGLSGETYLVYSNYDVILKWNRSTYFATTVGLLADAIAQGDSQEQEEAYNQ
ncbi:MAG: lytic transglycosylase [Micavibrio sp.]|nr:lytic transglycosylase [Micavibrio sp.]|tara:strand:+ start:809 stop:1813 length:1005 start_codon:yes stop_codon:yes gene_type:complete